MFLASYHRISTICFLEMYEMKKDQREVNGIFYVPSQGKDFSVHEPSAKAALEEEEKKRNSELTRAGKKRTKLVYGAYARIQKASKANGRCDGFPDVVAVKHWIKKVASGAGASGAGASAGAGAGGSN